MKKILIILLFSHLFSTGQQTIILLHGFMGWGRDEMGKYYYWGGFTDLQKYLQEEGFNVYTVSVGPISSNWDRAIETYYQIKGGQVNYGVNHSEKFNLIQKPKQKKYKGLFEQWDDNNPIHIIAHSQGGQTARMLEYLLETKFDNEDSELLSNNLEGMIKSITTISTPHNGTILADEVTENLPFLRNMTPFFGTLEESKINNLYDFDLEQWDLDQFEEESTKDYLDRLANSPIIDSKNFSAWDLSIEGAKEFNDIYSSNKNVYYFSYPTYATKELKNKNHIPDLNMPLMAWIPSLIIGKSSKVTDDWHMNDGIVSTISMKYPINSNYESEPNKLFNEDDIEKGVWQVMTPINQDHHTVIGHKLMGLDHDNMKLFYKEICTRLYQLD